MIEKFYIVPGAMGLRAGLKIGRMKNERQRSKFREFGT